MGRQRARACRGGRARSDTAPAVIARWSRDDRVAVGAVAARTSRTERAVAGGKSGRDEHWCTGRAVAAMDWPARMHRRRCSGDGAETGSGPRPARKSGRYERGHAGVAVAPVDGERGCAGVAVTATLRSWRRPACGEISGRGERECAGVAVVPVIRRAHVCRYRRGGGSQAWPDAGSGRTRTLGRMREAIIGPPGTLGGIREGRRRVAGDRHVARESARLRPQCRENDASVHFF